MNAVILLCLYSCWEIGLILAKYRQYGLFMPHFSLGVGLSVSGNVEHGKYESVHIGWRISFVFFCTVAVV